VAIESTARHWRQSGERRASLGRLATAAAPVAAAPLPRRRSRPRRSPDPRQPAAEMGPSEFDVDTARVGIRGAC